VSLLVLDGPTVRRLLPMSDCIEVMADALAALARGELHQPLRMVVRPPAAEELLALMPAHRDGDRRAWSVKAVTVSPGNAARGLDVHQGAVLLLDGETGRLRAVVDGSAITAVRTAAVSAVATRVLARSDADTLAILGAGGQARSHLEALAAVRSFRLARVWSRTPAHAAALGPGVGRPRSRGVGGDGCRAPRRGRP